MPAASSTHLILVKPCHGTSPSLSVTISSTKKYCPFSLGTSKQPVLFYFCLFTVRLIWRPFCPVRRGKEDGGGVSMGAMAWGNGPLRYTHIYCIYTHIDRVTTQLWECESISFFFLQSLLLLFLDLGSWTWEVDHIPHECRGHIQHIFYMCLCVCGHVKIDDCKCKGEKILTCFQVIKGWETEWTLFVVYCWVKTKELLTKERLCCSSQLKA